ncbi:MAG: selenium cofactor biosynthesis protein YqeC [Anaerolineae bacterium]
MKLSHALRITPGDVVAFVGGGGKTTAMFQLANELASSMRVLTTTSTRIFAAQIKRAPAHVTFDPASQTVADILPHLDAAIARHGQVLLIGQADAASGKAFGILPAVIDELVATGHFDLVLNEADGSRMRPFKAPAAHEPVIPVSTTLVTPLVGLDAPGQPLSEETVHRAELVSRLSGTPLGQPVTPQTIAAVLCHPEGGLKNVPARARVTPLLNKLDRRVGGVEGWRSGGVEGWRSRGLEGWKVGGIDELARRLLGCERVGAVALGAVQNENAPVAELHSRAAVVVLAAGGSTRFGSPKQVARWGGKTLIEQAVDTALASWGGPVAVVLGAEVERSRAALGNRPVQVVINEAWAQGQSSSMQAGLAALPDNIGCAVFMLVDLPGVTPDLINRLILRHRQTLAPLVWPEFEGRRGNPVLFDRRLFAELNEVSGDTGGKPVLLRHHAQAERVAVTDPAILQDIDRVEDVK